MREAMVVKRNTRNEGSTHRNPTVPRVQPLLKCATSCRVRTLWMDGGARGHHTERCLQVNGSHHDRITQLVIHHPQSSHSSCSQLPHSLRPNPAEGGEAGLTQLGSRTVARSPTHRSLQYDHLPAAANSAEGDTPPRRSTPFDGLGSHTSLGVG